MSGVRDLITDRKEVVEWDMIELECLIQESELSYRVKDRRKKEGGGGTRQTKVKKLTLVKSASVLTVIGLKDQKSVFPIRKDSIKVLDGQARVGVRTFGENIFDGPLEYVRKGGEKQSRFGQCDVFWTVRVRGVNRIGDRFCLTLHVCSLRFAAG